MSGRFSLYGRYELYKVLRYYKESDMLTSSAGQPGKAAMELERMTHLFYSAHDTTRAPVGLLLGFDAVDRAAIFADNLMRQEQYSFMCGIMAANALAGPVTVRIGPEEKSWAGGHIVLRRVSSTEPPVPVTWLIDPTLIDSWAPLFKANYLEAFWQEGLWAEAVDAPLHDGEFRSHLGCFRENVRLAAYPDVGITLIQPPLGTVGVPDLDIHEDIDWVPIAREARLCRASTSSAETS